MIIRRQDGSTTIEIAAAECLALRFPGWGGRHLAVTIRERAETAEQTRWGQRPARVLSRTVRAFGRGAWPLDGAAGVLSVVARDLICEAAAVHHGDGHFVLDGVPTFDCIFPVAVADMAAFAPFAEAVAAAPLAPAPYGVAADWLDERGEAAAAVAYRRAAAWAAGRAIYGIAGATA